MTLTLWLFGREVFAVSTEKSAHEPGDCTTQPVGFALPGEDLPTEHRKGW